MSDKNNIMIKNTKVMNKEKDTKRKNKKYLKKIKIVIKYKIKI